MGEDMGGNEYKNHPSSNYCTLSVHCTVSTKHQDSLKKLLLLLLLFSSTV